MFEVAAAVVLGLCAHGLATARALAQAGVTVFALKRDLQLPGAASRYVKRIFKVDDLNGPSVIDALTEVRGAFAPFQRVVLIPVNDRQVRQIAVNAARLRPHYDLSWCDQADAVHHLLRKDNLQAVCDRQGLSYPATRVFTALEGARKLAAELAYPAILKPVWPMSSFKTAVAANERELMDQLRRYSGDLPILGQRYIEGGDRQLYFAAMLLDHGRVVHAMAGRKLASFPPARGQTTIAETVDAPEVIRLAARFFEGSDISGPASLEMKRDVDGRYWVIEPTVGRTDFWVELCIAAGFNLPLMEYRLALGLPPGELAPVRDRLWVDTEKDPLAYLRLCLQSLSLRPRGKTPVFPYAGHRDWRPTWRAGLRTVRRVLSKPVAAPVAPPAPKLDGAHETRR